MKCHYNSINAFRPSDVSKLTNIGSDNSLTPGRYQAIKWTYAAVLWIGTLRTNFGCLSVIKFYEKP